MKEISQLFKTNEIIKIKELLEKIINKIEKSDREKQNKLLNELVETAQKTNEKLRKDYQVCEGLAVYTEVVSPLALITEEICNDAGREDMLEVLKFNLNNYFKQFKEPKENDMYVDVETLEHILTVLDMECDFFKILKIHNINLSVMLLPAKFRKSNVEVINYNEIINRNFTIHCFRFTQPKNKKIEMFETCLEQFGLILKNILVGSSKKAPEDFLDIFDNVKELQQVDTESKELTALFANSFAHYVIEKMEIRITEKLGPSWKEASEDRDEETVKKLMEYFDKIFEKLLKEDQREEWDDNEQCPCGSGKRYKSCCKNKKVKYYKTENENEYIKSMPMHPELEPIFYNQKVKFKKLFGRTPDENDYVLGGVLLKDFKRFMKLEKRKDTFDRAWLYAYEQTGIMLSEENKDMVSDRDIKEFARYVDEYKRMMKGKVKGGKWNILQATEATNFILENLGTKIEDMIYVLNLFVNSYSEENDKREEFVIRNIKDFLVFCAYKASINLSALNSQVEQGYYDSSMAVVRILFEILINVRAYKRNPDLFEEKILSVVGVQQGTHRKIKIEKTSLIENIQTKQTYKYEIQKRQLAIKSGNNYDKIYDQYYRELSEFIHLDTESARGIFSSNDLFLELDECLTARFVGMIFGLEIIIELTQFEGNSEKISKDITYFSNMLLKEFLDILPTIISIEDKEIYHLLEETLKEYKTNYKINYQRTRKCEIY